MFWYRKYHGGQLWIVSFEVKIHEILDHLWQWLLSLLGYRRSRRTFVTLLH
jgi:hypothetical protein